MDRLAGRRAIPRYHRGVALTDDHCPRSGAQKDLYERVFKTSEYFCVNPDDWSLQGWHLENMHYVALQPDAPGWLWSRTLQLWLGIQEGRFQGTSTNWPRFFTPAG